MFEVSSNIASVTTHPQHLPSRWQHHMYLQLFFFKKNLNSTHTILQQGIPTLQLEPVVLKQLVWWGYANRLHQGPREDLEPFGTLAIKVMEAQGASEALQITRGEDLRPQPATLLPCPGDHLPFDRVSNAHSELFGACLHASPNHQSITRLKDVQWARDSGIGHCANKHGNILIQAGEQKPHVKLWALYNRFYKRRQGEENCMP